MAEEKHCLVDCDMGGCSVLDVDNFDNCPTCEHNRVYKEKKHIFQLDENGALRLAFVGTISEFEAQLKKDYDALVEKVEGGIAKYKEELAKLPKPDLEHITAENAENVRKYIHYATMAVKDEAALATLKCPSIADGAYFVVENIGKTVEIK